MLLYHPILRLGEGRRPVLHAAGPLINCKSQAGVKLHCNLGMAAIPYLANDAADFTYNNEKQLKFMAIAIQYLS